MTDKFKIENTGNVSIYRNNPNGNISLVTTMPNDTNMVMKVDNNNNVVVKNDLSANSIHTNDISINNEIYTFLLVFTIPCNLSLISPLKK